MQSTCTHINLSGVCEWQSRYLLKIPSAKPCINCNGKVLCKIAKEQKVELTDLVPPEITRLAQYFADRQESYLFIGKLQTRKIEFMAYPYQSMDGYTRARALRIACNGCTTLSQSQMFNFQCSCVNAFKVKKHILLETVDLETWTSIMDEADKHQIFVYVHDLCSLPYTVEYEYGMFVYVPDTKRTQPEQFIENEVIVDSLKVSIKRPVINNWIGSLKSLWTKRFISTVYISYGEVQVNVTDLLIAYTESVLNGTRITTSQQLLDSYNRIQKHVLMKLPEQQYVYHKQVVYLHKLTTTQRNEKIYALVLHYVTEQQGLLTSSDAWLKKVDNYPSMFMVGDSTIMGVVGTKEIPEQKKGSQITEISYPIAENSASLFQEVGPSINGHHRIVPPADSQESVLNSLQCRQNAFTLDTELDGATKAYLEQVAEELARYCQYDLKDIDDVVQGYDGAKKLRYEKAREVVRYQNLLFNNDFNTNRKTFLKCEALYKGREDGPEQVSWRLIQGIADECTLVLQSAMIPLSKAVAQLPNYTESILSKFVYTSGMDANAIGSAVDEAVFEAGDNYSCIEADFTNYDASQGQWCNKFERYLFQMCVQNKQHCCYDSVDYLLSKQSHTTGFVQNRKSGGQVLYSTPFTRKSGDANTSVGNSVLNIAATRFAYKEVCILDDVQKVFILGDDNLTILKHRLSNPQAYLNSLKKAYATLGFTVKLKYTEHIAKVEYCNMIFAPVIDYNGKQSLTLISKAYRLLLKFNAVRKSSIKSTLKQYIFDNLFAIKNTLQFYPGIKCYQDIISSDLRPQHTYAMDNQIMKTPKNVYQPDMQQWRLFTILRYDLTPDQMVTDIDLTKPGNHYISWFDNVQAADSGAEAPKLHNQLVDTLVIPPKTSINLFVKTLPKYDPNQYNMDYSPVRHYIDPHIQEYKSPEYVHEDIRKQSSLMMDNSGKPFQMIKQPPVNTSVSGGKPA